METQTSICQTKTTLGSSSGLVVVVVNRAGTLKDLSPLSLYFCFSLSPPP